MAGTDPFGREKGDDPLAEMGWTTSGTAAPAADIAAPDVAAPDVAAPEQPDRRARRLRVPPPRHPRRRRPSRLRAAFVLLVVLFVAGSVLSSVIPAIVSTIESVDELDDAVPRVPSVPGAPSEPGDAQARPPRGLSGASLLRRDNLAPALRRLQRTTGASSLMFARIDAESVIVQTPAGGGRTRFARATWRGDAGVLSTSPGGGAPAFPWSRIDPAAPARIVRAATRGRRPSAFDYLVLTDVVELQWSAFLKDGRGAFTATLDGRTVRPLGG